MTMHRQEIATQQFNFIPTTFEEAVKYATIFANSGMCPDAYKGRPNDILIIWQMGRELGLEKMQALRTLGCINGIPFAYGDGKLALIRRHSEFIDMKEWFEGDIESNTLIAFCTMERKGKEPVTRSFSVKDAIRAGLWNKKGVWQQYPTRMLQHRARGFCANDTFPDATFGLMSEYEAKEVTEAPIVPLTIVKNKGMNGLEEAMEIKTEPQIIEAEVVEISEANSMRDELLALIKDKKVPVSSQKKWCKKFNVDAIENIPIENMEAIINHLKNMETK